MSDYEDAGSMDAMVIDVDTTNTVKMGPVAPDEYKLQCVKAEGKAGVGANGEWQGISCLFDIPDEVSAQLVNYMIFLPSATGTEKQIEQSRSRFGVFKEAFGFAPAEKFTPADLVGREVWAVLTLKDDPEYGPQNKIQRFVVSQG